MLPCGCPVAVHGHARQQRLVLERAGAALVDPQLVRIAVVGDVEVGPAVAVDVGGEDAEPARRRARDARRAPTRRRTCRRGCCETAWSGTGVVDRRVAVVARRAGGEAAALHVQR